LILDEPTNHLDIDSREALEEALEDFPGTVLAVSHDRYFINRLFRKIWSIERGHFGVFDGNYEYYKEKQAEKARVVSPSSDLYDRITAPSSTGGTDSRNTKSQRSGSKKDNSSNSFSSRPERSPSAWEKDIAEAELRLQEIDNKMLDPRISSDAVELAQLQKERDIVQEQLDELYAGWMNATGN